MNRDRTELKDGKTELDAFQNNWTALVSYTILYPLSYQVIQEPAQRWTKEHNSYFDFLSCVRFRSLTLGMRKPMNKMSLGQPACKLEGQTFGSTAWDANIPYQSAWFEYQLHLKFQLSASVHPWGAADDVSSTRVPATCEEENLDGDLGFWVQHGTVVDIWGVN